MATLNCQVAIIGAGPYGLSAAAYLQAAKTDVRIFGKPMDFWRNAMPQGMVLRSTWRYSHIADPYNAFTLNQFASAADIELPVHLRLDQFLSYGDWFLRHLVPNVDPRMVMTVERTGRGFLLLLQDGDTCLAERVVVATGLAHHKRQPPQFDGLASAVCTHAAGHSDFAGFAGKRVAVIGGGQAAVESAVLLWEAGAEPEIIVRAPRVHWLGSGNGAADVLRQTLRPLIRRFFAAPLIGTFPLNLVLERPAWFQRAPRVLRQAIARHAQRPGGAAWLLPRLTGLPISSGVSVLSATHYGNQIELKLDDGSQRSVDHVLLATGYRFDISNLDFLPTNLISKIDIGHGYPVLSKSMESSVSGLHFIGVPAVDAYGPIFRFVYGTGYSSESLSQGICGRVWKSRVAPPKVSVRLKAQSASGAMP